MTDERKAYLARYRKEKLSRIPLDVSPELHNLIRLVAYAKGLSVNGYIRQLIEKDITISESYT